MASLSLLLNIYNCTALALWWRWALWVSYRVATKGGRFTKNAAKVRINTILVPP